jgi:acetyl-CoA carboxylase biotin carboxyl carrier protein
MKLDDIREILDLVREHDLAEFELERDGLKVRVRKVDARAAEPVAPAAPAPAPVPVATGPAAVPDPSMPAAASPAPADPPVGVDLAVITSPFVGTFYRSSEPGARPMAEVGDVVKKGQPLCIIEAMKLMNEIESECDGEVMAVYVENGRPVQFGDRLFSIKVK